MSLNALQDAENWANSGDYPTHDQIYLNRQICADKIWRLPTFWAVPWLRLLVASLSAQRARVRSRVNSNGIYGGLSGTGTGFSPSSSVLPLSLYHSIVALHAHIVGDEQYVRQWQQFRDVVSPHNKQSNQLTFYSDRMVCADHNFSFSTGVYNCPHRSCLGRQVWPTIWVCMSPF
jgi:hypothetical protein